MRILVCDDDREIVDAIEIYLQQEGFEVEKAYDGEEAIARLQKQDIDLIGRLTIHIPSSDSL